MTRIDDNGYLSEGNTVKCFFQSISWNTVSGSFHETWNTFMKYFYFSIQHSLRMFLNNKKISFTEKRYRVKFNRKDIVQKIQKYQNVSEWNHVPKPGATKVHVLTFFRTSVKYLIPALS